MRIVRASSIWLKCFVNPITYNRSNRLETQGEKANHPIGINPNAMKYGFSIMATSCSKAVITTLSARKNFLQ
jgi:hypothetical protein